MSDTDVEALRFLKQSEHRFRLFLIVVTLAVALFSAFMVVRVSNQVSGQTRFIINYLRCVGQAPASQRGPGITNTCFETYAPEEFN